MTKLPATPRARLRAVAAATVCFAGVLTGAAPAMASDPLTTVLDRTNDVSVDVPAATERAQDRLRRRLGGAALLENDPVTGTARVVARLDGFLTPPSSEDPESIALDYVREHASAFGLDAGDLGGLHLTKSEHGADGTVHLAWEQRAGGLLNVDGGLQAAVNANGRLINVRGGVVPDLDEDPPEPLVSADTAYAAAMPETSATPLRTPPAGADRTTSFATGGSASLVRYQDAGEDRLGWSLLVPAGSDAFYDAIVDARTGVLQRRINRVRFASHLNHFDVNPRADPDGEATNSEVPAHWLDTEPIDPETDYLDGPYVHAVSDLDDTIFLPPNSEPPFTLHQEPDPDEDDVASTAAPAGEPQWEFDPLLGSDDGFCDDFCSWRGGDRDANREFSTAQLFWYVNSFRDHLAVPPIGFTDANGGFADDDKVLAQALDGALTDAPSDGLNGPDAAHRNNASMLTLPKGLPASGGYGALMQVHLFAFSTSRYDGAHDAALVFHEYAHGLSDRLVTDAAGFASMFGHQPGALSEATSDFYALDFLAESQHGLVPDTSTPGEVHFGKWLQLYPNTKGLTGTVRTQGLDCAVGEQGPGQQCPGTSYAGPGGYDYGDFGSVGPPENADEVHDNGEIWAETLWSIRTAIAGPNPAPEDLARVRTYVTNGLRLAPDVPTFLDMRNAIVLAAFAAGASDQELSSLWQVFASRGMGWSATTSGPDDLTPTAASDLPPAATTGDASSIEQTSATLSGQVDPNGTATSYVFQVGETTSYGAATAVASAGGGTNPVGVTQNISGLRAGTTYHYRVVAFRGAKQLPGLDRTFTTAAALPPPPPSPIVPPTPTPAPRATVLMDTRLSASRTGSFKVKAFFGDAAPAGEARFTVLSRKGKRLARATTPVRVGQTVIKTLRLSKKGRRAIRRGKSKTVTLELRLPSGQKYKKTLKLTRKKR